MSEQESQKRGVRSSAQKEASARDAYEPIPPSQPVAGAFGEHKPHRLSDEELSLSINTKRSRERKERVVGRDNAGTERDSE